MGETANPIYQKILPLLKENYEQARFKKFCSEYNIIMTSTQLDQLTNIEDSYIKIFLPDLLFRIGAIVFYSEVLNEMGLVSQTLSIEYHKAWEESFIELASEKFYADRRKKRGRPSTIDKKAINRHRYVHYLTLYKLDEKLAKRGNREACDRLRMNREKYISQIRLKKAGGDFLTKNPEVWDIVQKAFCIGSLSSQARSLTPSAHGLPPRK